MRHMELKGGLILAKRKGRIQAKFTLGLTKQSTASCEKPASAAQTTWPSP